MACEHKSCFFYIFYQLEDRVERPGLMAVVMRSMRSGGVLYHLLILITCRYMHVAKSTAAFFVSLLYILSLLHSPDLLIIPPPKHQSFIYTLVILCVWWGGTVGAAENSDLLIALRGHCDIVVHLARAEKRGLQSIISDLRRFDSSIELQSL